MEKLANKKSLLLKKVHRTTFVYVVLYTTAFFVVGGLFSCFCGRVGFVKICPAMHKYNRLGVKSTCILVVL